MTQKRNSSLFILFTILLLGFSANASAKRSADDIRSGVIAALQRYYDNVFDVTADDKGKVVIRGQVDTYYDKLDVYEIASQVKGVTEIEDLVENMTQPLPDNMVKANILNGLRNSSVIIEPDSLNVRVTDGLVFLGGTVSFPKEKLMAETIASSQDGVRGLDNEIRVLSPAKERTDKNLRQILSEVLKNKFPMLEGKVKLTVDKGNVSLNGTVTSLWEKANVRKECSKILGVKSVAANLKIKT